MNYWLLLDENMMKWLKRYWWVFVVVILIILMPVGLNFVLSRSTPYGYSIIGKATDWLNFWGGYLGSVIMAGITLYVLNKQLKQNHEENEVNRKANEQVNEQNRQLQIKVLEYQQQMQWLNSFRQVSGQYVQLYSANDLIAIANVFISNPQEAHNMIKSLYDRIMLYDTQFAYWRKKDNYTEELMNKISPKFKQYNDVLQDIQQIINFRRSYPAAKFGALVPKMPMMTFTKTMQEKITRAATPQSYNALQPFLDVVLERIHDIKDDVGYVQNLLYDYIQSEQTRINKILEN